MNPSPIGVLRKVVRLAELRADDRHIAHRQTSVCPTEKFTALACKLSGSVGALLARRDPVVWQEEKLFTSCAVNEASGAVARKHAMRPGYLRGRDRGNREGGRALELASTSKGVGPLQLRSCSVCLRLDPAHAWIRPAPTWRLRDDGTVDLSISAAGANLAARAILPVHSLLQVQVLTCCYRRERAALRSCWDPFTLDVHARRTRVRGAASVPA